jgi:hypothetical protein
MGFLDGMMNKMREVSKDSAPMRIAGVLRDPDRNEDDKYNTCKDIIKNAGLSNSELMVVNRSVGNAYGSAASRAWARVMKDFMRG